jgi:uncharacterized protein YwbE
MDKYVIDVPFFKHLYVGIIYKQDQNQLLLTQNMVGRRLPANFKKNAKN